MYRREDLVEMIKPWAKHHPSIQAAWEGGSAATKRMDAYSDLDLSLIVTDDAVENVFSGLESFLEKHFTITHKYRLPEPTWHGFSQCFYKIDQVSPFVYLDIAIIKVGQPDKLMEQDRHGIATVWFDDADIYDPTPTSSKDVIKRGQQLYQSAVHMDFLIITEVEKAIARGFFIDTFPTFLSFISRQLCVMLNLKYRPERADFGLRYARLDYADSDTNLIETSLKVSSIEAIKEQFIKIKSRYDALKEELKATYEITS